MGQGEEGEGEEEEQDEDEDEKEQEDEEEEGGDDGGDANAGVDGVVAVIEAGLSGVGCTDELGINVLVGCCGCRVLPSGRFGMTW